VAYVNYVGSWKIREFAKVLCRNLIQQALYEGRFRRNWVNKCIKNIVKCDTLSLSECFPTFRRVLIPSSSASCGFGVTYFTTSYWRNRKFLASLMWELHTSHREYCLGYMWYLIATKVIGLLEGFFCLLADYSIPIFDWTNYTSLNFN
jgi:hypothetical protein